MDNSSVNFKYTVNVNYSNNLLSLFLLQNLQQNLNLLEQHFKIVIYNKGNNYKIQGNAKKSIAEVQKVLSTLNSYLNNNNYNTANLLNNFLNTPFAKQGVNANNLSNTIKTKRKTIVLKNAKQVKYCNAIDTKDVVFATGPAGGGKTYLAVAKAVEFWLQGKIEKIIVSRPIVEAGESLGFLPGDMHEKVDPYLTPIKDAVRDMLPPEIIAEMQRNNTFEVAPIAFMRGRTFANSFVILDEAQNASIIQLKMLLTRLGENSKLVINGDLSQVDLTAKNPSGLRVCIDIVKHINQIALIEFTAQDIVRSALVQSIVNAFSKHGV